MVTAVREKVGYSLISEGQGIVGADNKSVGIGKVTGTKQALEELRNRMSNMRGSETNTSQEQEQDDVSTNQSSPSSQSEGAPNGGGGKSNSCPSCSSAASQSGGATQGSTPTKSTGGSQEGGSQDSQDSQSNELVGMIDTIVQELGKKITQMSMPQNKEPQGTNANSTPDASSSTTGNNSGADPTGTGMGAGADPTRSNSSSDPSGSGGGTGAGAASDPTRSNSGGGTSGSGGGGEGGGKPSTGNGMGLLQAAKAILKQIGMIALQMISAHPIPNIAKNETNQKLARLAISYLDAAQVDSALSGTIANQDIIMTRTQATTIEGDAQTGKQYWIQALNSDKQSNKDTHKLADRA